MSNSTEVAPISEADARDRAQDLIELLAKGLLEELTVALPLLFFIDYGFGLVGWFE
jgi:hypothetical protein